MAEVNLTDEVKKILRDLIDRGDDIPRPAWFEYEQAVRDALAEIGRLQAECGKGCNHPASTHVTALKCDLCGELREPIATPGESIGPQNPAKTDGGSSKPRELPAPHQCHCTEPCGPNGQCAYRRPKDQLIIEIEADVWRAEDIAELILEKRQQAAEIERLREIERKFHDVMTALQRTKMKHGLCLPVERKACTACAAQRKIDELLKDYKGPRVVLA